MLKLTKEEELLILEKRKEKEYFRLRRERQAKCTHKNKTYQGSYGHNGDDWYFCRECGLTWSD